MARALTEPALAHTGQADEVARLFLVGFDDKALTAPFNEIEGTRTMTGRLDYNQIAPSWAKELGGVYS
jgi:hypothetical protein